MPIADTLANCRRVKFIFREINPDLYNPHCNTKCTVQLNCFIQRPLGLEYITSTKKTITESPPPQRPHINLSVISTCNCIHMCCWDDPAWRSFVCISWFIYHPSLRHVTLSWCVAWFPLCMYAIWCSLQTKHRRAISNHAPSPFFTPND